MRQPDHRNGAELKSVRLNHWISILRNIIAQPDTGVPHYPSGYLPAAIVRWMGMIRRTARLDGPLKADEPLKPLGDGEKPAGADMTSTFNEPTADRVSSGAFWSRTGSLFVRHRVSIQDISLLVRLCWCWPMSPSSSTSSSRKARAQS